MIKRMRTSLARLRHDENATAMLEYSILIGLITVAVILMIVFVGQWVTSQWSSLSGALS
jgi:pilus assembly protein Flp/PilA